MQNSRLQDIEARLQSVESFTRQMSSNFYQNIEARLQIIDARTRRISLSIRRLTTAVQAVINQEGSEMATLQEVRAGMDALRAEVAAEKDEMVAAVNLIRGFADQIAHLGASATDLDTLKSDIETVTAQMHANAEPLAAAIAEQPPASEPMPTPDPAPVPDPTV